MKKNIDIKDELLDIVAGGSTDDNIVLMVQQLLNRYGIKMTKETILFLKNQGGCTLRNAVKAQLPKNDKHLANIVPCF